MRPFDLCGTSIKEYAKAMAVIDASRDEMWRIKMQKAVDEDVRNAYEQVAATSECMEFPR